MVLLMTALMMMLDILETGRSVTKVKIFAFLFHMMMGKFSSEAAGVQSMKKGDTTSLDVRYFFSGQINPNSGGFLDVA